jgi:hypothetical protein
MTAPRANEEGVPPWTRQINSLFSSGAAGEVSVENKSNWGLGRGGQFLPDRVAGSWKGGTHPVRHTFALSRRSPTEADGVKDKIGRGRFPDCRRSQNAFSFQRCNSHITHSRYGFHAARERTRFFVWHTQNLGPWETIPRRYRLLGRQLAAGGRALRRSGRQRHRFGFLFFTSASWRRCASNSRE